MTVKTTESRLEKALIKHAKTLITAQDTDTTETINTVDVTDGLPEDFYAPEEDMPTDDEFRTLQARAKAIEEFLNKRLTLNGKLKVYCRLRCELGLDDYADLQSEIDPCVFYDYDYRLAIVTVEKKGHTVWAKDIYIPLYSSNEEALTFLTQALIRELLPTDKQHLFWV